MGGLNIPRKLHNHRRVVLVRAASCENNQATSVYLKKEENQIYRTVSSSSSTTFAEIRISVISLHFCHGGTRLTGPPQAKIMLDEKKEDLGGKTKCRTKKKYI